MTTPSNRLIELAGEATADGAGRALIRFKGPGRQLRQTLVDVIQLDGSASATIPTATLWRSAQPGSSLMTRNRDGQSGWFQGGGVTDRLLTGETWTLEFTGATAGSVMRATLVGSEVDDNL